MGKPVKRFDYRQVPRHERVRGDWTRAYRRDGSEPDKPRPMSHDEWIALVVATNRGGAK